MNQNKIKMDLDSVSDPGRFFSFLARDLKSLAISNIQFFENGKQSHHAKFHMSFSLLYEYLDVGIEPSYRELSKHVHLYDFSPDVKGNGYRSLLQIVHKCCLHLLQLSRYISSVKDSMLFRKKYYAKELEAYVSALGQLRAILYYALKLLNYCQEGELFADEENLDDSVSDHLMMEVESLNQECFYGRCLGFQFCESMMRPVQIMNIAMASYSEGYLESSGVMQVATSVFNSGKYFLDPELRATQLAKVTRTADIKFCKAFWSISEHGLAQQLPSMVCPSVEVNEFFPLGPDAFELPLVDGSDTVVITPPCAHVGPGHVMVRLLSAQLREGQQTLLKSSKSKSPVETKPRTPGLVVHMHGGGFIAQSSRSHEMYLRDWARILDIPILSVDYSLSPELPFPRALEDCFYAYAWAVKNCLQLGSLGERIVLCGDSAGGNLAISTAMRAASFDIRRPDGVLGVYPVTMARYLPSPARLLSLMDPILPVGIVSRCLAAYAGINEEHPLASPSTQEEFQSKSSLNSLQMQTAESSDSEWVIIGQDQDECRQIGRRMDKSPSLTHTPTATSSSSAITSPSSNSAVDGMEDSFHEEDELPLRGNSSQMEVVEKEMVVVDRKFNRSDTLESDEVEIFSQLQEAGSCVIFSKDDKRVMDKEIKENDKSRHISNNESSSSGGGGNRSKEEGKEKLGESVSGFQETARSVMEGAQNMLTSLSSYIPSRGAAPAPGAATAAIDNSTTVPDNRNSLTTKSTDFYANRSISSDGVDPRSSSFLPNTSKSEELSCDALSSFSEGGDGVMTMMTDSPPPPQQALPLPPSSSSLSNLKKREGNFNEDPSEWNLSDGDNVCQQQNLADRSIIQSTREESGHDKQVLFECDVGKESTSLHQAQCSSQPKASTSSSSSSSLSPSSSLPSLSPSSSTDMFSNQSPPPTPQPISKPDDDVQVKENHCFDSISLISNDDDYDMSKTHNISTTAEKVISKPSVGTSPVVESTSQILQSETITSTITPSLSTQTAQKHASTTTTTTTTSNTTTDLSIPVPTPPPTPPSPSSPHDLCPPHTKQSNPPINHVCPIEVPSSSPNCTQITDSNESPTNPYPTTTTTTTTTPTITTPSTPEIAGNVLEDNMNEPTKSTHITTTTDHDTHNSMNKISSPSTLPHPTTTTPKPPSDLNLYTTTTTPSQNHILSKFPSQPPPQLQPPNSDNNKQNHKNTHTPISHSPSPNQIFIQEGAASDLDSTDTEIDVDGATSFKTSCLQFLGEKGGSEPTPTPTFPPPPPMPNDQAYYTSHHANVHPSECQSESPSDNQSKSPSDNRIGDKMGRSDSMPIFSAMLSPTSPTSSQTGFKGDNQHPLPFPNGLKMGMSPSDFKRQSFTPHSPINTMRKALVVRNPYMSPLMAEPELLKGLPPVCLVASQLDPLLDDSVMFARKIRGVGVSVQLHLVDDLPHGFLNFALLSQEAKRASQFCAGKLKEMMKDGDQNQDSTSC